MHELVGEPDRRSEIERLGTPYQERLGSLVYVDTRNGRREQLATDTRAAVDDRDRHIRVAQRSGSGESGDAGTDDGDVPHQRVATSSATAAMTAGSSLTDAVRANGRSSDPARFEASM